MTPQSSMKLPVLFRWFLFCCSLSILQPILGQEKVTVAYGSAFEGSDGNIFGSSDGSGFDGSNKATIALGYFTSGFDVASSVASEDVTSLIESFNVLHSANFSSVAAPGFLGTGGTFDAAGVGETPYMFLAAGITDFADASSATEYGLFTDSGFGIIPDGGSPVPVDWSIARLSYDSVLLGSENLVEASVVPMPILLKKSRVVAMAEMTKIPQLQSLRSSASQKLQLPSGRSTLMRVQPRRMTRTVIFRMILMCPVPTLIETSREPS